VELVAQVNGLDLVICAALGGGFLAGWHRGLVRQLLDLAGFYVSLVLAAQYHRVIADWVMSVVPYAPWVAVDTFVFLFLLTAVMLVFTWVGYQIYTDTHIAFIALFDGLMGAVFGVLTVALEVVIGLSLLRFVLSVNWFDLESWRQLVLSAFTGSTLEPVFTATAPIIYVLIRPWLPAGLPALLTF